MCIAIYSPMGNNIPSEKYLKNSFEYNDDGAGFAFNTDEGRVKICKGFMTYESFINAFNSYNERYNFKDRGVLIHFRITTHGGTCSECCHPFPLIADEGAMHKLEYTSDYAVIHNGIISLTSLEANKRNKMSDTMVFIEKYLTRLATNKNWFENDYNFELIYDLIDSKMAVLNGRGEIKSTSGFTQDEDGNWYSNTSYKVGRLYTYTKGCEDLWGDDWGCDYDSPYSTYYESGKKNGSSKNTRYIYVPVRLVKRNEMVYMTDGEALDYDEHMPVYISMQGEVYIGAEVCDEHNVKDAEFYGYGTLFNMLTFAEEKRSSDKCILEKISETFMV